MEPASHEKKYWAFISYSSKDRKWGQWLHKRLENYPIPREFQGTEIFDGAALGRNLRPVFRDRDELAGSADLAPAILKGLRQSRFLVVLCSPNSAQSKWVNKEIEDFRTLEPDNDRRILALILDGEPNATSDRSLECFPPALRSPAEPLAGDLRKDGDGKERGFLKILAGISQLDFDTLYRRHERAQRRKRLTAATLAATVILVLTALTVFAFQQRRTAIRNHAETLYREGLASLQRNESLAALDYFVRAAEQRPEWAAPRAHLAELVARSHWPVAEWTVNLNTDEDADYFLRQMQDTLLAGPDGPLLLSSHVGFLSIELGSGKPARLAAEEVAELLDGGPHVDLNGSYSQVDYRWDDGVALGFTSQPSRPFLYRIDGKSFSYGDEAEWEIIAHDESSGMVHLARLDSGESIIVESCRVEGERLIPADRKEFIVPAEIPDEAEGHLRGISKDGAHPVLATEDSLWILGEEQSIELPVPRVNAVAFSPAGRHIAVLRAREGALHGEDNLLLSFVCLEDFESFTRPPRNMSLPDGPRLQAVSQSEEVPLRNPLLGYSGKWYEQGLLDLQFVSDDCVVVLSGHACHFYRLWDRRAYPIPSRQDDEDRLPVEAEGVTIRESGAELPPRWGSHILREEFPIQEALWLGNTGRLATAASYKFYGSSTSVWDAGTGTRVIGPLDGWALHPDSNSAVLHVGGHSATNGLIDYRREILVPDTTPRWLMELGTAIARQDYRSIPLPSSLPPSLHGTERDLAERLLSRGPADELPLQVGSTVTRHEWRTIHLPRLQESYDQGFSE